MACILIIDDIPSVRESLDYCLQYAGHKVVLAADGPTGLRLAAEQSVDVVMLDVEMPRMSGIAVCETIRANPALRHLPVLMMTGRGTREIVARAMAAGASVVLNKPFDMDHLKETLTELAAS